MNRVIKERKDIVLKTVLAVVFLILLIFVGSKKEGFFVDEYFSFLLANTSELELDAMQGTNTYTGQELLDVFYVQGEADQFDFRTVWENQINDNHPPLFYSIVHIICSLTMQRYDMITVGLAINIVIAMLAFVVIMKLAELFIENKMVATVYAFISCSTCYFVNSVIFVRMYMLLMFFTMLLVYVLCRQIGKDTYKLSFFVQLYLITFLGVFTQYFFLIMLVFCCFVMMIYLIFKKKWKELVGGIVSVIAALGTVYLCFPAVISHLFASQRGTQAFSNAGDSDFVKRLFQMYSIIDIEIFGKISILVLVILVLVFIFYGYRMKTGMVQTSNLDYKYVMLLLPAIMSFCVIAKIAPGSTDRYIMETMPFISLGIFLILRELLRGVTKSRLADSIVLIVMILCAILSYQDSALNYLYEHTDEYKARIEQYGTDTKVIYLYAEDDLYRAQSNLYELRDMTDITFYWHTDFLLYTTDFSLYDQLLVFSDMDMTGEELNEIMKVVTEKGQYVSCEEIEVTGYATAYLLNR